MAKRVSTRAPAKTKSVAKLESIEMPNWPDGFRGVAGIFLNNSCDGDKPGMMFRSFSDKSLLGMRDRADSFCELSAANLDTIGHLIANYHPGANDRRLPEIGDLVSFLADQVRVAHHVAGLASQDLAKRGYNEHGEPLGATA